MSNLFDEFKEVFDKMDILEQIQFVFYHNCRIHISREQASRILTFYLFNLSYKFFKEALIQVRNENIEEDNKCD